MDVVMDEWKRDPKNNAIVGGALVIGDQVAYGVWLILGDFDVVDDVVSAIDDDDHIVIGLWAKDASDNMVCTDIVVTDRVLLGREAIYQ